MQWVAALLMMIGTSLGVYGAASAYYVPIDAPDNVILNLTLNDDAGATPGDRGAIVPIAKRGRNLDAAAIAELRTNSAGTPGQIPAWKYVRVKEFAWSRWPGKWITVTGTLMLLGGALLARKTRGVVVAAEDGSVMTISIASITGLEADIEAILRQSQSLGAGKAICDLTDAIQRRWITPLVRGQQPFIAANGIGRAAESLSALAAVERNLNRAWSAAADDYLEESIEALEDARIYCQSTREKLAKLERGAA